MQDSECRPHPRDLCVPAAREVQRAAHQQIPQPHRHLPSLPSLSPQPQRPGSSRTILAHPLSPSPSPSVLPSAPCWPHPAPQLPPTDTPFPSPSLSHRNRKRSPTSPARAVSDNRSLGCVCAGCQSTCPLSSCTRGRAEGAPRQPLGAIPRATLQAASARACVLIAPPPLPPSHRLA